MNRRPRANTSGFTLIEVLIGLAILGITSGLLVSAVYSLALGANTGVARLDRLDTDRIVLAFLRRQLESARPAAVPIENRNEIVFSGTASEVRFVGHLPAHRGGGGLTLMSLYLERSTTHRSLMFATHDGWASLGGVPPDPDRAWTSRELLGDVEELRFSYFGDADASGSPRWSDEWRQSVQLPELIRVQLRAAGRAWPPLVVAIRSHDSRNQPHLIVKATPGQV